MNQPNIEAAIAYALHRLAVELPREMTYHSVAHTRDEVLPAAAELAGLAELGERDTRLLRVAAAYHDVGYIERPDDHEICSARVAAQVLPAFAFDAQATEDVMALILATRLPQTPRNLLQALMCDADLSGLASPDFFDRSLDLLRERRALGQSVTDAEWWSQQIDFLAEHHYWTEQAEELREAGKARNLMMLQQRLANVGRARPGT